MTDDTPKVTKLPVRFRKPPEENRTLFVPWEVGKPKPCYHDSFVVDVEKSEVECAKCSEKLNPMWVLGHLANHDRRMIENQQHAHDAMNRLAERSRTKCQHCGKLTRIRGI